MNLADYVKNNMMSLSRKKKKNLVRKIKNKLRALQPRILEAKILGLSKDHKVYKYQDRLNASLQSLEFILNND